MKLNVVDENDPLPRRANVFEWTVLILLVERSAKLNESARSISGVRLRQDRRSGSSSFNDLRAVAAARPVLAAGICAEHRRL